MAISGGAKPSIAMRLVEGTLTEGTIAMRQNVENDAIKASLAILAGILVFVQLYSDIPDRVRKLVAYGLEGER